MKLTDHAAGPRRLTIAADTGALAELGRFLTQACVGHPRLTLIELAVTEVVVNAALHGGATTCKITVEAFPAGVKVLVEDDGAAFDVSRAEAKALGELREGGYGVGIIQQAAAELSYGFEQGWGKLTMSFPF